ncbi:hypothetical protein, partial [Paenibacillus agaridevorans]|uniref:hypothetical protein n=1 Tax=Paenibacillus agaridevorans TaxID=171404 RepID=UPI001C62C81B
LSIKSSETTSYKGFMAKVSAFPLLSGHKSLRIFFSSSLFIYKIKTPLVLSRQQVAAVPEGTKGEDFVVPP